MKQTLNFKWHSTNFTEFKISNLYYKLNDLYDRLICSLTPNQLIILIIFYITLAVVLFATGIYFLALAWGINLTEFFIHK